MSYGDLESRRFGKLQHKELALFTIALATDESLVAGDTVDHMDHQVPWIKVQPILHRSASVTAPSGPHLAGVPLKQLMGHDKGRPDLVHLKATGQGTDHELELRVTREVAIRQELVQPFLLAFIGAHNTHAVIGDRQALQFLRQCRDFSREPLDGTDRKGFAIFSALLRELREVKVGPGIPDLPEFFVAEELPLRDVAAREILCPALDLCRLLDEHPGIRREVVQQGDAVPALLEVIHGRFLNSHDPGGPQVLRGAL